MVVYCLKQNDTVVYVGSTKCYQTRLKAYKNQFYGGIKNTRLFKFWRPLGWDALKFEIIDDLDDKLSLEDRLTLEGEYIAKFDAPLNTVRNPIRKEKPSHYTMEWRKKNPEKTAAQKKKTFAKWYATNGEERNRKKREARADRGGSTEDEKAKQKIRNKRYQDKVVLKRWLLEFKDIF